MKKFKRILAAISTAAISFASLCGVFSASAIAIEGRETFRIYVDVPSNSGVHAAKFNLRFDAGVTDFCRCYQGTVKGWGWSFLIENNIYNGLEIKYKSENGDLTVPGTLGVITMLGPGSVYNIFDIVDVEIVSIQNSAKVNLPTSRVRFSNVMVGDVNRDGKVNSDDSTLLSNYLNGKASLSQNALRAADTNGDFGVTNDDLTHLNNYLDGKVNYFSK